MSTHPESMLDRHLRITSCAMDIANGRFQIARVLRRDNCDSEIRSLIGATAAWLCATKHRRLLERRPAQETNRCTTPSN